MRKAERSASEIRTIAVTLPESVDTAQRCSAADTSRPRPPQGTAASSGGILVVTTEGDVSRAAKPLTTADTEPAEHVSSDEAAWKEGALCTSDARPQVTGGCAAWPLARTLRQRM